MLNKGNEIVFAYTAGTARRVADEGKVRASESTPMLAPFKILLSARLLQTRRRGGGGHLNFYAEPR